MGINTYFYYASQGGKNHIDFITKELIQSHQYNNTANNNGTEEEKHPFINSSLHKWLNEDFYNNLPSDLKEVISNKDNYNMEERYSSSGLVNSSTNNSRADLGKIWIPTEFEIVGSVVYGTPVYSAINGVQYQLFANSSKHRIKSSLNNGGSFSWWTATVANGSNTNAVYVSNTTGLGAYNVTTMYNMVAPCFRIRRYD